MIHFNLKLFEKWNLSKRLFARWLCPAVVCPLQGAGHPLLLGQPHLHLGRHELWIQIPDLHDKLGNLLHQLHHFARGRDCHTALFWLNCVRKVNDRRVLQLIVFFVNWNNVIASWCLCYLFYNAAVFITLLYWTMLYESGSPSYINLYVHGLQAREHYDINFNRNN